MDKIYIHWFIHYLHVVSRNCIFLLFLISIYIASPLLVQAIYLLRETLVQKEKKTIDGFSNPLNPYRVMLVLVRWVMGGLSYKGGIILILLQP